MSDSSKVTHGFVRFIKKDVVSIIDIFNIKEFSKNPPKHSGDFNKERLYLGKLEEDDGLTSIEVFGVGSTYIIKLFI